MHKSSSYPSLILASFKTPFLMHKADRATQEMGHPGPLLEETGMSGSEHGQAAAWSPRALGPKSLRLWTLNQSLNL